MSSVLVQTSLGMLLVIVTAAVAAAILRAARVPGAGALGGFAAGVLLSSAIFGIVSPTWHGRMIAGDSAGRAALVERVHRNQAERAAGEMAGLTPEGLLEMAQRHDAEEAALREALSAQARDATQPFRIAMFVLACALMALGAAVSGPARSAARVVQAIEHPHLRGVQRPSPLVALSVGGWSALLPASLALLVFHFAGVSFWPSLAGAAALAIGPWALSATDLVSANRAEAHGARTLLHAGRIATLIALMMLVIAMAATQPWQQLLILCPVLLLLASPLISPLMPPKLEGFLERLVQNMLLPAVTALACVHLNVFTDFSFWPVLALAILASDGRWLGTALGSLLLGSRRVWPTMRLAIGAMAAGPSQIVVAGILAGLDVVPREIVLAVVISAVLLEMTTPARRVLATRLEHIEHEHEGDSR